jgi:hypothetical protein
MLYWAEVQKGTLLIVKHMHHCLFRRSAGLMKLCTQQVDHLMKGTLGSAVNKYEPNLGAVYCWGSDRLIHTQGSGFRVHLLGGLRL